MFFQKVFLKNFAKFTDKQLCWIVMKLQGSSLELYQKREHWCFPANSTKYLRTPIFYNISERLLQNVKSLELQNHKKQYAKETSWVIIYTEAFVCVLSVCGEKRPNILSNFLTQSVHFNFISEICFKRHIKRKFIIRLSCVVLARTTDVSFNQTHIPKDLLF